MEYILVTDEDERWYVIPSDKSREWGKWVQSEEWNEPYWADRIFGDPTLLKFKNYRID